MEEAFLELSGDSDTSGALAEGYFYESIPFTFQGGPNFYLALRPA
jgi:hypothetical protein